MSTSLERDIERVAERALRASHRAGGAPLGIWDGLEAFFTAIDFTEPAICGIFAAHALFIISAIATRKNILVQAALLATALVTVLSASRLNAYGHAHWKEIGFTQNYFDQYGIFVSLVLSVPMILTSFAILIYALASASRLLIAVKREQLGINARDRQQTAAAAAAATTSEATGAASSTAPLASQSGAGDGQASTASPATGTSKSAAASLKQRRGQAPASSTTQ